MSCPMSYTSSPDTANSDGTYNAAAKGGLTYGKYLQVEKLLSCHVRESERQGKPHHDEHLFITIHQVYELWFKQVIIEIDSVREMFQNMFIDERQMLVITSRLNRVMQIIKTLVDQIMIMETMSPMDFAEFRDFLAPSSGFQSCQFRLLENKLGLRQANRVKYGKQHYTEVFEREPENMSALVNSENEMSLLDLLQRWLERTPGLEKKGFDFWGKFQKSVEKMLQEQYKSIQDDPDQGTRDILMIQYQKQRDTFNSIFSEDKHNELRSKGERSFTHKALQGAMMISFYRDEPRFSLPYQMLQLLMDIDSLIIKWRYNHVMLVQRMLGTKTGTGGSSGYYYLRSTVSDRYKVFLDLFNLSSFLIPHSRIPVLNSHMRRRLSRPASNATEVLTDSEDSGTMEDGDDDELSVKAHEESELD